MEHETVRVTWLSEHLYFACEKRRVGTTRRDPQVEWLSYPVIKFFHLFVLFIDNSPTVQTAEKALLSPDCHSPHSASIDDEEWRRSRFLWRSPLPHLRMTSVRSSRNSRIPPNQSAGPRQTDRVWDPLACQPLSHYHRLVFVGNVCVYVRIRTSILYQRLYIFSVCLMHLMRNQ